MWLFSKKIKEKIISVVILNTGGTFNKEYNEINGIVEVREDNNLIEIIMEKSKITKENVFGLFYKDSLELTNLDREKLVLYIKKLDSQKILIVHGTDTMDITAKYLDTQIKDKTIVLTGAMKPYSIYPVEATSNLILGYGYLLGCKTKGIYIAMHGNVKEYTQIQKNKEKGIFECLS